jgi:ABC-type sugar transport system ATPase subunit
VRQRNVAMVYQQFINYPSMTVFDNIASPLKLRGGMDAAAINQRVQALADKLHIEPFLRACRPNCRAASSSAWPWPARWPRMRR